MEVDMGHRADSSGIRLTGRDAAVVKGMLARGDRQHDIAAWFGVNGGRIAEIANGAKFPEVLIDVSNNLPPRGPYASGKEAAKTLEALIAARSAIDSVIEQVRRS
jgi:hypothetical protein